MVKVRVQKAGVLQGVVAHKATHATGGTDALSPADIGALPANDASVTDARNPTGPAGGDLSGTYPNPQIGAGVIVDADVSASAAIAESKLALASDAAAGTASRRTLGTGATQAAAGNDSRLSDTRTPTDASVTTAKMAANNKGIVICTSTTRPASPVEGQHIYETDTDQTLKNTGTPAAPVWTNTATSAPAASETVSGTVELATATETRTGTDATRAVHPAGLSALLSDAFGTYIAGLELEWVSNTQIQARSGSAWVPSLSRVLDVPNAISATVTTPTNATWYYAYLTSTGTLELSTQAPNAPYKGSARIKGPSGTPDNTRRYLGAVRTADTGNRFMNFSSRLGFVRYLENTAVAPFNILVSGVATSLVGVSCTAVVPPTSTRMFARRFATGGNVFFSHLGVTPTEIAAYTASDADTTIELHSSQAFQYRMTAGNLSVYVYGYYEER